MMKVPNPRRSTSGSALSVVVITSALLMVTTGIVLTSSLNRRKVVTESSVWEEALVAAEAGIHEAAAQLETGLTQNALPANDALTGAGQTFTFTLSHAGGDSSIASVTYTLRRNDITIAGMSRPYYSIISTGTVLVPASRNLSSDSRDVVLRKLDMVTKNGAPVGTVKATRTIEAWAKPVYSYDAALRTEGLITLNNYKIFVDSFNSNDPSRSLTGGLPSETVGFFNIAPFNMMLANIATNSQFISAGDATIYGDAMTNGGTVGGTTGIQGLIRDDYYEPLAPVYAPTWASTVTPGVLSGKNGNQTVTNIKTAVTIRGGSPSSPARYVVDSIALAGSNDVVTFDFGINGNNGAVDPTRNSVELYVRGDLTTKGGGTTSLDSGSVVVVKGVNVKIWVLGNIDFTGNGMTNNNSLASSFAVYGVNAPTVPASQDVKLAGNSRFFGTIYAPAANLKLAGGGSDGTFVGALTGKTAFLNGNTKIRYDEALGGTGVITRFVLGSWYEDTKKVGTFTGAF
jgi:hypothetical protein